MPALPLKTKIRWHCNERLMELLPAKKELEVVDVRCQDGVTSPSGQSFSLRPSMRLFDMSHSVRLLSALVLVIGTTPSSVPVAAQWLSHPTPGAPRTRDGKVDLSAPTPRQANGKPDLSGLWTADQSCPPPGRDCGRSRPGPFASREINDIGVSLPGGLPYQPWLAALVKERTANHAKDDPHVRCFPDFFLRAYGLPHF